MANNVLNGGVPLKSTFLQLENNKLFPSILSSTHGRSSIAVETILVWLLTSDSTWLIFIVLHKNCYDCKTEQPTPLGRRFGESKRTRWRLPLAPFNDVPAIYTTERLFPATAAALILQSRGVLKINGAGKLERHFSVINSFGWFSMHKMAALRM